MISLILMMSPFAPHLAEEIWQLCKMDGYIFNASWPTYIEELTHVSEITMVVQVNGKVRGEFETNINVSEEEIVKKALSNENVQRNIEGKEIIKTIVVPKKLVNIVVR